MSDLDPTRGDAPLPALDIASLQATDEMLDRLAARRPTPDDLDDPVVAALALFAGEVDRAEVSPVRLERELRGRGAWPPAAAVVPPSMQFDEVLYLPTRRELRRRPTTTRRVRLRPVLVAASALVVAAVGGGVSSVVGGDGLPFVQRPTVTATDSSVEELTSQIALARAMFKRGDTPGARRQLTKIRQQVQDAQAVGLTKEFNDVAKAVQVPVVTAPSAKISTSTPSGSVQSQTPSGSGTPTSPAPTSPTPSSTPSTTPTDSSTPTVTPSAPPSSHAPSPSTTAATAVRKQRPVAIWPWFAIFRR